MFPSGGGFVPRAQHKYKKKAGNGAHPAGFAFGGAAMARGGLVPVPDDLWLPFNDMFAMWCSERGQDPANFDERAMATSWDLFLEEYDHQRVPIGGHPASSGSSSQPGRKLTFLAHGTQLIDEMALQAEYNMLLRNSSPAPPGGAPVKDLAQPLASAAALASASSVGAPAVPVSGAPAAAASSEPDAIEVIDVEFPPPETLGSRPSAPPAEDSKPAAHGAAPSSSSVPPIAPAPAAPAAQATPVALISAPRFMPEPSDAIAYVGCVKARFGDSSPTCATFFQILLDRQKGRLSVEQADERIIALFAGEPDLLAGFQLFRPTGKCDESVDNQRKVPESAAVAAAAPQKANGAEASSAPVSAAAPASSAPMSAVTVLNLFRQPGAPLYRDPAQYRAAVVERFGGESSPTVVAFDALVAEYATGDKPAADILRRARELFADHDDLLAEIAALVAQATAAKDSESAKEEEEVEAAPASAPKVEQSKPVGSAAPAAPASPKPGVPYIAPELLPNGGHEVAAPIFPLAAGVAMPVPPPAVPPPNPFTVASIAAPNPFVPAPLAPLLTAPPSAPLRVSVASSPAPSAPPAVAPLAVAPRSPPPQPVPVWNVHREGGPDLSQGQSEAWSILLYNAADTDRSDRQDSGRFLRLQVLCASGDDVDSGPVQRPFALHRLECNTGAELAAPSLYTNTNPFGLKPVAACLPITTFTRYASLVEAQTAFLAQLQADLTAPVARRVLAQEPEEGVAAATSLVQANTGSLLAKFRAVKRMSVPSASVPESSAPSLPRAPAASAVAVSPAAVLPSALGSLLATALHSVLLSHETEITRLKRELAASETERQAAARAADAQHAYLHETFNQCNADKAALEAQVTSLSNQLAMAVAAGGGAAGAAGFRGFVPPPPAPQPPPAPFSFGGGGGVGFGAFLRSGNNNARAKPAVKAVDEPDHATLVAQLKSARKQLTEVCTKYSDLQFSVQVEQSIRKQQAAGLCSNCGTQIGRAPSPRARERARLQSKAAVLPAPAAAGDPANAAVTAPGRSPPRVASGEGAISEEEAKEEEEEKEEEEAGEADWSDDNWQAVEDPLVSPPKPASKAEKRPVNVPAPFVVGAVAASPAVATVAADAAAAAAGATPSVVAPAAAGVFHSARTLLALRHLSASLFPRGVPFVHLLSYLRVQEAADRLPAQHMDSAVLLRESLDALIQEGDAYYADANDETILMPSVGLSAQERAVVAADRLHHALLLSVLDAAPRSFRSPSAIAALSPAEGAPPPLVMPDGGWRWESSARVQCLLRDLERMGLVAANGRGEFILIRAQEA